MIEDNQDIIGHKENDKKNIGINIGSEQEKNINTNEDIRTLRERHGPTKEGYENRYGDIIRWEAIQLAFPVLD